MTSPLSATKNRLIFAACWLVWLLVHFIILYNWDMQWETALADSAVSNILLALVCQFAGNIFAYYRPERNRFLYIFFFCVAISGLYNLGVRYGLAQILSKDPDYLQFLNKSLPVRFAIALLATGFMALVSELWFTLEEQRENEVRKTAAEKLAKEAELYKLRQQLQPHFLFNSLNSISALVSIQPERARKMIQQLSDFLRGTLKKEENQWITLGEELQHLQLYLDIEKVRFGHRLNTIIHCDEQCREQRIPHMLLQPVVENAIKFGLYDTIEDVTISIDAACKDYYLELSVQNPFDPETSLPKHGTGFGLSSVQRRLYLLFARQDLVTASAQNNLFTTTIKIPQA
ncbi:MAG: histidine kinase [Chitinophagaceae bacterium]